MSSRHVELYLGETPPRSVMLEIEDETREELFGVVHVDFVLPNRIIIRLRAEDAS